MTDDKNATPQPGKAMPTNKKVFDIMRPGRALAPANSRNVVMDNKPPVADDQFVEKPKLSTHKAPKASIKMATDLHSRHPLLSGRHGVNIKPSVSDDAASEESEPVSDPPATSVPEATSPKKVVVQPPRSAVSSAPSLLESTPAPAEPTPSVPEEVAMSEQMPPSAPELTAGTPVPEADAAPEVVSVSAAPKPAPAAKPPAPTPDPALHPPVDDAIPDIMSQDELMSQTTAPAIEDRRAYVSHHRRRTHWWQWLLMLLAIIALALVAFNFLLDAEVVTTELDLPHTDLL